MEFVEFGMVKIEAEDPMPSLDQLCISLEKRRSTCFDVSASVKEEYMEELTWQRYLVNADSVVFRTKSS